MQISNYLLYCLFENIQSNHAMTNSYKRKDQNTKHETQHYVEQVNPPVTHIQFKGWIETNESLLQFNLIADNSSLENEDS